MEWTQFAILLIYTFGLFLWNRSESRQDIRHMDAKLEATRVLVRDIYDELAKFHARLCVIEERNRK